MAGASKLVADYGRSLPTCRGYTLLRQPVSSCLGQQAEAWAGTATGPEGVAQLAFVTWRWHERVGMVLSFGVAWTDPRVLVALAKKQEARMEAAR